MEEWKRLSGNKEELEQNLALISSDINFDNVMENYYNNIYYQKNKIDGIKEKVHKFRVEYFNGVPGHKFGDFQELNIEDAEAIELRNLIEISLMFINYLYDFSRESGAIDHKSIRKAQFKLFKIGICHAYPCRG